MDSTMNYCVIIDEEQQLTLKLENHQAGVTVKVTLVYAKYSQNERLRLWEVFEEMAITYQDPWLVGGDFNVIGNEEEKLRGFPITLDEIGDFNQCNNICNLEEAAFTGSKYT